MRRTKFIAIILTVAMLAGMTSVFPAITASAASQISNVEPAIPATVGTAITLSNYSVELDNGTVLAASDISWYDGATKITTFTPSSSGVKKLTAKKTSDNAVSKTIYVVSKTASETDYVLYFNDFNSEADIADFVKNSDTSIYSVANSKLTITGNANNPRTYLPVWLADFGNYRIDAVGTQTNNADASRWISFIYRAQNVGGAGTPFYHMAVRNNMMSPASGTTGGVECCALVNGAWTYYQSSSYTEAMSPTKNYKFSVLAKNNTVQYQIDGNPVIHVADLPTIATKAKGGVGMIANSSKLVLDSIKVSLQLTTPEAPKVVPPVMTNVRQPASNTLNHVTNVGIVQSLAELQSYSSKNAIAPATLIMYANGANLTAKDGTALCTISELVSKKDNLPFMPAFYVNDQATIDIIIAALKPTAMFDVLFISKDTSLVKYAREKYTLVRGAVDFSGLTEERLNIDLLMKIRGDVKSSLSLIAILPEKYATKDNVSKLQALETTVWVMDEKLEGNVEAAKLITSGASGIITDKYADIENALKTLIVPNTLTKTPLIIGHRGNPSQAPENSLSSYKKAVENGANIVETDIYLSSDKQIVIMHDDTIDRTTTGSGRISSFTVAQLKQFYLWGTNDAYKNIFPEERIPTLEELFEYIKTTNVQIFVEIKAGDSAIVQPLVDLINKYSLHEQVSIICFNSAQLLQVQKLLPTMTTGYLLNAPSPCDDMATSLNSFYTLYNAIQGANSTMNINYGNFTQNYVSIGIDRGVTMWPWTYSASGSATFNKHYFYGLDGLTTDDAQYSKSIIQKVNTDKSVIMLSGNGSSANFSFSSLTYGGVSANITASSSTFIKMLEGENLITVNNGVVTAKADSGKASFMLGHTITALGKTYTLYSQPITVTIGGTGGIIHTYESGYKKENVLVGVRDNTTLAELLDNLQFSDRIVVLDAKGAKITSSSAVIGTGCKVQYVSGSTVEEEIIVVVIGDINGDGKINSGDYLLAKRAFLKTYTLSDLQKKAACIGGTELPTAGDYLKIKRHYLNTYNIFDHI